MKTFKAMVFVMLTATFSLAQSEKPFPCGTLPIKDPWLSEFQLKLPDLLEDRTDSLIYVPLSIHIVGNDDGTGYFRVSNILDAFCTLNNDYEQSNIQFYIKDTIIYHNRSDWNDHPTVVDGAFMMFEANVPNTLNIYFVSNPAGNCGYNLPYAGIAMNTGCSSPTDHTWAHEIGHAFSLPHPFLGWEGDVYDYSNPTPDRVTYDYTYFKDTLILDTTIIDTAWVEYVERKNCLIAGDGFCDTPPDYLSRRWPCDQSTSNSNELQKDPDGVDFRSDGTLFMSYANDACASRFSADQIIAMHANIVEEKPYLIDGIPPADPVSSESPVLVSPLEGGTAPTDNAVFTWEPVENANGYVFQVSRFRDFRFIQEEVITDGPETIISGLRDGIRYYWRVKGFNHYYTCTDYTDVNSFTASQMVNANQYSSLKVTRIFPNPAIAGTKLNIEFYNKANAGTVNVSMISSLGQTLFSKDVHCENGANSINLSLNGVTGSGWYFIKIKKDAEQSASKIFIE